MAETLPAKFLFHYAVILPLETATAYHPQTNGHSKRYNRTFVLRMRPYIVYSQQNSDMLVKLLTYACKSEPIVPSTSAIFPGPYKTPIWSRSIWQFYSTATTHIHMEDTKELRSTFLAQLATMSRKASGNLCQNQRRYKTYVSTKTFGWWL